MSDAPDPSGWNKRFEGETFLFGEAPNAYLRDKAAGLTPGDALCVADGESRNGVWLAEQGWRVLSLDFSDVAQRKAAALAARRGVEITLEQGDVHGWAYPQARFDLVADIFSQFSTPDERAQKWAGMCRALKPGGWLIVQGYRPKQLDYGTGGPKAVENLYTEAMLREAFGALEIVEITSQDVEVDEGPGHNGMSALIGMVARAPM